MRSRRNPSLSAPRSWLFAALPLVAAVALVGCGNARPDPLEPIPVGVVVPLTGALAGNGGFWQNAAKLAGEQINSAGGLFEGREIQLLIGDSGSNAATSNTEIQGLIDDGARVIIGPAASSSVAGTLDTVAAAEIPQISCCATSPTLTEPQANRAGWFFRTAPNDKAQGQALAYISANGYRGPHPNYTGEGGGLTMDPCPELMIANQDDDYGKALAAQLELNYFGQEIFGFNDADEPTPWSTPIRAKMPPAAWWAKSSGPRALPTTKNPTTPMSSPAPTPL